VRNPLRRDLIATALLGVASLSVAGCSGSDATAQAGGDETAVITIAEPLHSIGYLPLYAAIESGAFADVGLTVEVTTLTGGGHVNAVLSGEVFGFIGGVESGAVANIRGASLIGVANVVNRGNVYFTAPAGAEPAPGEDLGSYFWGATIVGGRHGGTPNAILRYILTQHGLDPDTDTVLQELEDSSAVPAAMRAGSADIAVTSEPQLGLGVSEGVWSEPFLNVPEMLGPYAYSSIVVPEETIETQADLVQRLVDALMMGQELIESDPDYAFELASQEFDTLDPAVIQATLDRAYADSLWDGSCLSEAAVEVNLEVARVGGILADEDAPQTYDDVATTQFTGEC